MNSGTTSTQGRRRTGTVFRVVASLVTTVVVLGVGETVAHFVRPESPELREGGWVLLEANDTRLWALKPGVQLNDQFSATVNARGYRGDLATEKLQPGVPRVVMVGDSTIFGHGVDDAYTLSKVVRQELVLHNVPSEVLNFGVPGYSTVQTLIQLEEEIWDLRPDLLIVGNLWSDNDCSMYRDADLLRTRKVFGIGLLGRSALFRLMAAGIDRMRGGSGARIVTWMDPDDWPSKGVRRVPLANYAANLDAIVQKATRRGTGVLFLSLCNTARLQWGEANDRNSPWVPYFDAQDTVARHHGLPRFSACYEMASSGMQVDELFVDGMHFSRRGSGVVGAGIARELAHAGWPSNRFIGTMVPFDSSGLVDPFPYGEISLETRTQSPQRLLFGEAPSQGGASSAADDFGRAGR